MSRPARPAGHQMIGHALGILGAAVGGTLGYFVFVWLGRQGIYAMVLPGVLLGLGCATASRIRSVPLGILCGISATLLGTLMEWMFFPFVADQSLSFFLNNLTNLRPAAMLMIPLGGMVACWIGIGRERLSPPSVTHE